jgi:hypothetical protein
MKTYRNTMGCGIDEGWLPLDEGCVPYYMVNAGMGTLRTSDMTMLQELLDEHDLSESTREMLTSMQESLDSFNVLSEKQRKVVHDIHDHLHPKYQNLVSDGLVPRGREVPEPEALRHKPLKPPGRV